MIRVDLLSKNDESAYESFLKNCMFASVQNSLEWFKAITCLGEDVPYIILAKEQNKIVGVLPLFHYRCKFGDLLTTVAWNSTSNIIFSEKADQKEIYRALLNYSLALAEELDCIAISINTNPFLKDEKYYLRDFNFDCIMENFIQYVKINEIFDLKGNIMHPNYVKRTNLSRNLKKAKRSPIVISEDQTKAHIDECCKIYEKRMQELGIVSLPKKFFLSVLKELTRTGKGKFLFAFHLEKMVASCLFLHHSAMMDVHTLAMDSDYAEYSPNYALSLHMLKWARQNSVSILNWMSSSRRGDGVYNWKQQWGSHVLRMVYLTKIFEDISHLKSMNFTKLSEAYKFHYLLPFNLLENIESKFTTKEEVTAFLQSKLFSSKDAYDISARYLENPRNSRRS